jgi:glyoxylase-like metal-dependent hydrolase (beta-lactamase superfamily II)
VERVINTHHHEDHAGGDSLLQTSLGLPIAVPAEAVPVLQAARRLELYRRLAWGQPDSVEAEPLGEIVETRSYRFAVVPTPGHSHDHVCFFEAEEGWLFSGDLFIHERARYLDVDEDAYEIMASLRRVLALEPQVMICAHAGFVENPCRAIERKIAYWQSLSEEARKLYDEGLSTEQITTTLMGAEGLATHLSRGRFSKRNLIASLLSRGI